MSERFLKFIPSEEAMFLLTKKGHAFRLLTIIAEAARRYDGGSDGLHVGEAFIGGHEKYDMTEQNYRTAKRILVERKHILIIETNRTRTTQKISTLTETYGDPNRKVTTGVTTEGTKVKLLSTSVYDINIEEGNDRPNDRLTTDQRLTNDKLRKKELNKERKDIKEDAQSASPLRTGNENIFFNSESFEFQGISDQDRKDWVALYPHIDFELEIKKAIQWLKSNPSKSNKKLWRKFLIGWFTRANDSAENKKAFKASGSSVDRKTKNMDGTPIKSKAEDLF